MAGSHVVYLDRVESAWPFGLRFERGSHVPLHCTSMGKLFLSQLSPPKRAVMLRAIPLHRYTERTLTDLDLLEAELEKIRAVDFSTDDQEFLAGVVCVAVPVHGPKKQPVAALAVSAPLARMSLQQGLTHLPLLQAAAKSLSATIQDADPNEEETT
jgi:IclR family acetate operon transcriptional repressor